MNPLADYLRSLGFSDDAVFSILKAQGGGDNPQAAPPTTTAQFPNGRAYTAPTPLAKTPPANPGLRVTPITVHGPQTREEHLRQQNADDAYWYEYAYGTKNLENHPDPIVSRLARRDKKFQETHRPNDPSFISDARRNAVYYNPRVLIQGDYGDQGALTLRQKEDRAYREMRRGTKADHKAKVGY